MCGIAGYIGTQCIDDEHSRRCLKRMHHRGPNGSGIFRHEHAGRHVLLLHTRLAIIDLDDRAAQPMTRGRHTLCFNGELYNYLELRPRLEKDGATFRSQSDTEVLLSALQHWGQDGLDACEGMWAFALYDDATGALTLSRDRFGEKPLYYFNDHSGLYFASEISTLKILTGRNFPINQDQINRYLVNGYKSLNKTRESFHAGVTSLQAGTCLHVDRDGQLKEKRYWNITNEQDMDMSYEQAVAGARQRLMRSMELRLRSDVPLAFCMSGGVDSNSLLAIAKRVFDYDVHGFTVVNTDARYDEWDLVQTAIDELQIKHSSIPVDTAHFLSRLRKLVRQHDGPVCTITYYAHWLLMEQVAKAGYKVSVSGTAADELFTGYYDHHALYLAAVHGTDRFSESLDNWNKHIRPIVRNPLLQNPLAFIENPGQREHIYLDADRYASYLVAPFHEAFTEEALHPQLLRNRMLNELLHEVVPAILKEDDLNAMSYSIENRSPFLDRDLFEFMSTVPSHHLIKDGCNKRILRDAMRGIVPDPILDERRKVGFNAPLLDFLDVTDPAVQNELLEDGPVWDIVNKDVVRTLLKQPTLPNADSKFLFNVINVSLFLDDSSPTH